MRALLDVNLLSALLDTDHVLHGRAVEWFEGHVRQGWASCPITQNGCLRIMASPGYPNAMPIPVVLERLGEATATRWHEFWPDDISLLDVKVADPMRILGPRQLTDCYLLALAVRRHGCFVTFDDSITLAAVRGAKPEHLLKL